MEQGRNCYPTAAELSGAGTVCPSLRVALAKLRLAHYMSQIQTKIPRLGTFRNGYLSCNS
jgi:hypothetical protein